MAPREGDTWHARCHTYRLQHEGGGHVREGRGGGVWVVIHPPPIKVLIKHEQNNRKRKPKKEMKKGGYWANLEMRLLGQFVGGRKVVVGSIRGRKKRKKEKKGK